MFLVMLSFVYFIVFLYMSFDVWSFNVLQNVQMQDDPYNTLKKTNLPPGKVVYLTVKPALLITPRVLLLKNIVASCDINVKLNAFRFEQYLPTSELICGL